MIYFFNYVPCLYLSMKKGEKVYRLVIRYDDSTGECLGLCETLDRVTQELDDEWLPLDDLEISLSDFIPEEWLDLTDDINLVGLA